MGLSASCRTSKCKHSKCKVNLGYGSFEGIKSMQTHVCPVQVVQAPSSSAHTSNTRSTTHRPGQLRTATVAAANKELFADRHLMRSNTCNQCSVDIAIMHRAVAHHGESDGPFIGHDRPWGASTMERNTPLT
eukprot:1134250-Pelagomonas_calceolata.AAC.16